MNAVAAVVVAFPRAVAAPGRPFGPRLLAAPEAVARAPGARLAGTAAFAPPAAAGLAGRWLARLRHRRALRALLRQPDAVLADFGVTRAAAAHEAAKPFWRA